METSVFFLLSSSDEEDDNNINFIRRQIRLHSEPLSLTNAAFRQRFRLTTEAFNYVLSCLEFSTQLSLSVPPILQLAATLNLLESGSFQHNILLEVLRSLILWSAAPTYDWNMPLLLDM
ncbi:uncharacterized protein [Musca autumnalis]|uniref:uncharacterized protein n=1 Tax=Musca autumnalis TaxID=221902 RepID=UPI003CEDBC33